MKRKVALYNPYLNIMGGGEKHVLQILQALSDDGCEISIFWDEDLRNEIQEKFSFQCIKTLKFLPNIFRHDQSVFHPLRTLQTLRTFDHFFYVTDGSYFFSGAKKNIVFCMVPQKNLYRMNLINKLKTGNYHFISNSQYTQSWLEKWGIKNEYIYPYIDDKLINNDAKKQKIILSVGRFFPHLHSKQHSIMIKTFKNLRRQHPAFAGYKLVLSGGLKKEDINYFNQIKNLSKNDPDIIFKPNISLNELYKLYKLSNFFWHFTGFQIDEQKHPEQVEHLGITPLEAMAAGCMTFCYNAGGPKEIITDGKNGFLFNDDNELQTKMLLILNNPNKQKTIRNSAKEFIQQNFSYDVFKKRIKEIIL